MHAVTRPDGTAPAPGFERPQRLGELSAEQPPHLLRGGGVELERQQERIALLLGLFRLAGSVERGQESLGIAAERGAAPARTQEDVAERVPRLDTEGVRVLRQERLELSLRRLDLRGDVLGHELELLPQAPADDRVVTVQPKGQRLAVEHLLPDVIVDQPLELRRRRRPVPEPGPVTGQALDRGRVDHDPFVPRGHGVAPRLPHGEERRPGHEEVEQRLAQPAVPAVEGARGHGVYQIGEV